MARLGSAKQIKGGIMLKKLEKVLDQLYDFKPDFLSVGFDISRGTTIDKKRKFTVFDHKNHTHEFNSLKELQDFVDSVVRADTRRQILFRKF